MSHCRKRLTLLPWLVVLGIVVISHKAKSADLLLVSEEWMPGLREHVQAWEQDTGHRINWQYSSSTEEESALADVLIMPAFKAKEAAQRLHPLKPSQQEQGESLAPLLSAPWQVAGESEDDEVSWLALPLSTQLPLIYFDPKQAFARKEELPVAPSWQELARLAAEMVDPVNGVYGFCIDPAYEHAQVVRSMLAEADLPWLESESGLPYASAGWEEMARQYARMLAASGPPNAASLDELAFARLREAGKCALYLTAWSPDEEFAGKLMAVPGAAAFVSDKMPLVVVDIESDQVGLASSFAWSLVMAGTPVHEGSAGVRHDSNSAIAVRAWPAVQSMLRQPGRAEFLPGGWEAADAAGKQAMQALVDGLQPVDQVMADARESLAGTL